MVTAASAVAVATAVTAAAARPARSHIDAGVGAVVCTMHNAFSDQGSQRSTKPELGATFTCNTAADLATTLSAKSAVYLLSQAQLPTTPARGERPRRWPLLSRCLPPLPALLLRLRGMPGVSRVGTADTGDGS